MKSNERSDFGQTIEKIIDYAARETPFQKHITALAGSSLPLFLSLLKKKSTRQLLVVAESFNIAEQLKQDLGFFDHSNSVNFFPYWDTVPYDNQSPDKGVVAERFKTLSRILSGNAPLTITTSNALMHNIMPANVFAKSTFDIQVGESIDREQFVRNLLQNGFVRVDMVEEKGEFSVKGEIIDLFLITEESPVRIDFFDDEIETIRSFDVETQRSIDEISSLVIYPAQEIIFTDDNLLNAQIGLKEIKSVCSPQTYNHASECLKNGISFPGMDSLLPIFYEKVENLTDYYTEPPLLLYINKPKIEEHAKSFFDEIMSEYRYSIEEKDPTLDPDRVFQTAENLFQNLANISSVEIETLGNGSTTNINTVDNVALRSLAIDPKNVQSNPAHNVLKQLIDWNQKGSKLIIAAPSQSRADQIHQMMEELDASVPVMEDTERFNCSSFCLDPFSPTQSTFCIIPMPLNFGFRWIDQEGETRLAIITDEEIFGPKQKQRRVKSSQLKHFFSSLGDLKVGDYVVHVEYGVGKYEGLKSLQMGPSESDFLVLSYLNGDKVYVPVDKFHLVQKYAGIESGKPKLNKLGGKTWAKTKSKVQSEIDDMADELIRVAAERKAKKGIPFAPNHKMMDELALTFPYQETKDQEQAISEVLSDMEQTYPMDRLVCGDVGFGKTEVALRAAFKAVADNHQVGLLVPTTILAQQHYESFCKRFSDFPVKVAILSRFQTAKQSKETLKELEDGKVDILIGTHRILSKDIKFKKLGLLIIDEEQRFGVRHKEKIKSLKSNIDTLTLSATPIPRTLHMSMVGIRDISVINTAPMDRRAIRTRLSKFGDYVIKEAVNRELRRNGQVFFIHNRVESIYQVGQYLNQILPKVKIGIAHAQMGERELETIMLDFINHQYDVLLSTTIVESGLDIPNANTIIVNNAENFGLSQLYQLRGRVGRSNLQAYAYLLSSQEKVLTEVARKRLSVLQELNHLGAGFKIASYDLELRGAGNVLGSKQSGHIAAIGYEMYTAMIEDAVNKLRSGKEKQVAMPIEDMKMKLNFKAALPEHYISSMNQRLDAYKSVSGCQTEAELWEVRASLEDRFGKMPDSAVNLFHTMQIKLHASPMHVTGISQSGDSLELSFSDKFQPNPLKLAAFMGNSQYKPKVSPDSRIKVQLHDTTPKEVLKFLHVFRKEMMEPDVQSGT